MLFSGLLPLACSAFSLIEPKTTSLEMVPPTRGLSPLITNWGNVGSRGGISSTEAPFSVITPGVSSWHKTRHYRQCLSLMFQCISWVQQEDGSYFHIHSVRIYLLIEN
jgi:hypothetical protein